ncbi:sporulation initiation phosphotransferase B [Rhizophagus irregularis]|uniref:Sporulation initiation phosphotransferase B n=2 Tax=cellular organisms TaxID=131567 RepID=A0A2N0QL85_9GLOM|nr:Spo0B domain-containing protein [Ureibacillus massiliensis]KGR90424.1 hypothetical protein CD30_11455 [Ureibacillus massiliensis 4400831 = CIP 108448 = CCUG 49529]PKC51817.1 sporulation initiation phosphotransferase B [Rhizophagus irregularis]
MKQQPLSIIQVLRYANHDFMNHLQVLNMNLELGRTEESKGIIKEISESYRTFSDLNKLNLPKTAEWLHTARWRFPSINIHLSCNIVDANETQNDEEIVEYLEKTIIHVYDSLDAYTEQHLFIQIESNKELFKLIFHLKGKWNADVFKHEKLTKLKVQTYEETNESWKYELT